MLNSKDRQNLHWCKHNLHFPAFIANPKKSFLWSSYICSNYTTLLHFSYATALTACLPVWHKRFCQNQWIGVHCTLQLFMGQKTQTSYQCFYVRVNYCSPTLQGHIIRCVKTGHGPNMAFSSHFVQKPGSYFLWWGAPSRSAVAVRAACGRGVTRCV